MNYRTEEKREPVNTTEFDKLRDDLESEFDKTMDTKDA